MSESRFGSLHELALFILAEESLGTRLAELAQRAARAMGAATCSIMRLADGEGKSPRLKLWASNAELPPSAWNETSGRGETIAEQMLERGSALLVADIGQSEFGSLAHRRENVGSSFICVPVAVGKNIIGVMNLSNRAGTGPFDQSDLATADIVVALIGQSLQIERLQTLLRSRVAQLTLAKAEKEVAVRLTDGSAHPAGIAKMLAKSFYKDLAAAGFERGQIIEAASEIITQVTSEVARYQKRISRESQNK